MKITLREEGRTIVANEPFPGCEHVLVKQACVCGSDEVRGTGKNVEFDDYKREEDAVCHACGLGRGRIHVRFDTLFGVTEDQRALNGRWKVY